MGKVNLIISESFINNLSEYLIACGIKIPSLVVKIWKTDADLEKGNCQIVNLGSASLYQVIENLTSLYEEDGCAEICFNDSYCDECLIHSDKYELYLIDDHLKRLEEQAVLKTEEKERAWKKLEIRKRASFFKAPMCIPVNRWDTQKVDNFYEVFFLQKELSIETPMSVKIGSYWKEFRGEMVWCVDTLANVMCGYFSVDMKRFFKDGQILKNRAVYKEPIRKILNMQRERIEIKELSLRQKGINGLF